MHDEDVYYELKCDNDTINMKMLHKRQRTSPSFMSIREDRETSTTKPKLRLPPHFGIFTKCSQGIFAFGRTSSSPTSHEFAYINIIKYEATTYK